MSYQKSSCIETALQLLSRRDHGEHELVNKLISKGFSEKDTKEALLYCHHFHYIDDIRYAKNQVRQHIAKGRGKQRICQELKQKMISNEDIDCVLNSFDVDWFELARASALKKYRIMNTVDAKEYARRVRYLQYRGFNLEQIQYALNNESEE